jgi:hypothetical protein
VGVLGKSLNFIFAFQKLLQGTGRARDELTTESSSEKQTDVQKILHQMKNDAAASSSDPM